MKEKLKHLMELNGVESMTAPVTMDDLIVSAAMQELRICCLELGIDPNEFVEEE